MDINIPMIFLILCLLLVQLCKSSTYSYYDTNKTKIKRERNLFVGNDL